MFDTHHFECYNKLHPEETLKYPEEYIQEILETWARRGINQNFMSEQGTGRIGHHGDYIEEIRIPEIPK